MLQDSANEVVRKAAVDTSSGQRQSYAHQVQVVGSVTTTPDPNAYVNPFWPPKNTDWYSSNLVGLVRTVIYKQGGASGTVLKTVVQTFSDSTFTNFIVSVS